MLHRVRSDISSAEITPEAVYQERRRFLAGGLTAAAATAVAGLWPFQARATPPSRYTALNGYRKAEPGPESLTKFDDAISYNNFYEFSTDKDAPALLAPDKLTTRKPWTISVSGLCAKPGTIDMADLLARAPLEERIYRLRCVEAWSMVLPWIGIPLSWLLKQFEPLGSAKYVAFETLLDPERMPGQRTSLYYSWPYQEGLRMDEAMHPLTLAAVGIYGVVLPDQNGYPLRLVVPWKYGFKSIKSIAAIRFVEQQPKTLWNTTASREYGFYANVNPEVDHPRWSQARERRIGEFRKRDTLMFNGYGDQVASLYSGMDLRVFF